MILTYKVKHGSRNKYIASEVFFYMKDNDIPGVEHTHTLAKINEHASDYSHRDTNINQHSKKDSHLKNQRKARME